MSKRHQSSRRRSYGRRQHELNELRELHDRADRPAGIVQWLVESDSSQTEQPWSAGPASRGAAGHWLQLQGID
jgi:hypothetical protein